MRGNGKGIGSVKIEGRTVATGGDKECDDGA